MYLASRTDFETCLEHFYKETKQCPQESGRWIMEKHPLLRQSYLKRISVIHCTRTDALVIENDTTVTEEPDLTNDTPPPINFIQLEHHIAYSTSYQVPVLYMKAQYQDGTPLMEHEICKQIVPDTYDDQVMITQTEHPILGTPFWHLHPCDTRKLMNSIPFAYLDYIKTWLSFNGPVLKCHIAKEMFY